MLIYPVGIRCLVPGTLSGKPFVVPFGKLLGKVLGKLFVMNFGKLFDLANW